MSKPVIAANVRAVLPFNNGRAVFIGNDEKVFVIYVDESVGAAITMFMNNTPKERPLTHDLMGHLMKALGAKVDRVIINRSIPTATVIPVLVYPDVRAAVEWLSEAFGFQERVRIGEDHRSQMQIGPDGAVIVADVSGEQQPPQAGIVTHLVKVRVPAVDAQLERARRHGARVLQEPTEYEYGERECTVEDPAGHRWQFTQTIRDVAPEEWGGVTVTP